MLRAAEPLELGSTERTRIAWLRELFATELWSGTARTSALVELADRMRAEGDAGARAEVRCATSRSAATGRYPDPEAVALVLDAVERMPFPPDRPELLEARSLVDPVGSGAGDHRAARPARPGRRSRGAAVAHARLDVRRRLRPLGRPGRRGRQRTARPGPARPARAGAGLAGLDGLPHRQLGSRAAWRRGRRSGSPVRPARRGGRSRARWRGRRCGRCAASPARSRRPTPPRPSCCRWARARCSCSCRSRAASPRSGKAATATPTSALRRIFDPSDIAHHRVHPLVGAGRLRRQRRPQRPVTTRRARCIAALEDDAARSGSPILSMALHYARPVLADDELAEALFPRGSRAPTSRYWPLTRGAAAARLRRVAAAAPPRRPTRAPRCERRARRSTRSAPTPWGERARQELRASGGRRG